MDVYTASGTRVYVECQPEDYSNANRPECVEVSLGGDLYWPVARIVILLCRIALSYTFYK